MYCNVRCNSHVRSFVILLLAVIIFYYDCPPPPLRAKASSLFFFSPLEKHRDLFYVFVEEFSPPCRSSAPLRISPAMSPGMNDEHRVFICIMYVCDLYYDEAWVSGWYVSFCFRFVNYYTAGNQYHRSRAVQIWN